MTAGEWGEIVRAEAAEAVCAALAAHEAHGGAIPWPGVRKPYEAWKKAQA